MIKPEENGQKHGKWKCSKDLADAQIPEVDEPASVGVSGHECLASGQHLEVNLIHAAKVDEAGEEDEGQGRAVVLEEDTDPVAEEGALSEGGAEVGENEDEEGDGDGEIEGSIVAEALEDLNTLLEVDTGYVEAKDVAREACYPAEPIA